MAERPAANDALLDVAEVAQTLKVEPVTVYRWCRQGRLTCLKPGKSWRIRRSALEAFLRHADQPRTLVARLGSFLEFPDQVLAMAEDPARLAQLDAAFFQVAEARSGVLVKFYDPHTTSRHVLSYQYRRHGLHVEQLQTEGRFRWCPADDPVTGVASLRCLLAKEAATGGRPVWVTFDWEAGIRLDAALRQQAALAALVADDPLVVMTGVVEPAVTAWPEAEQQWQLLGSLRGVIRFARAGLMLSRAVPPPIE